MNDLPGMDELKSAGLLRKGQSIGGLGEQELSPDTLEAIESQNIDAQDSALLSKEDEIDLKAQNLSNKIYNTPGAVFHFSISELLFALLTSLNP